MTKNRKTRIRELYNGDHVLTRGVSPALVDRIQSTVPDPEPPVVILEDGENYPNPSDPKYQKDLIKADQKRDRLALYGLISFGMQLCDKDGNPADPPNDGWEFRLKRLGINWREEIEEITGPLEDEEEISQARKEAYLLLVSVSGADLPMIMELAGLSQEAVKQAEDMFQREAESNTDTKALPQK